MLFLVVLHFIKLQTIPNNIPEGNPLKSVYLTSKIALISRLMWSVVDFIVCIIFAHVKVIKSYTIKDRVLIHNVLLVINEKFIKTI